MNLVPGGNRIERTYHFIIIAHVHVQPYCIQMKLATERLLEVVDLQQLLIVTNLLTYKISMDRRGRGGGEGEGGRKKSRRPWRREGRSLEVAKKLQLLLHVRITKCAQSALQCPQCLWVREDVSLGLWLCTSVLRTSKRLCGGRKSPREWATLGGHGTWRDSRVKS